MAKVWQVHGTMQRDRLPLLANLPWQQCLELLELDEFARVEDRPTFGETSDPNWPTHIVVQIESAEAQEHGIKPGYFVSPLTPDEAKGRLSKLNAG
jgi:hypothetical protein